MAYVPTLASQSWILRPWNDTGGTYPLLNGASWNFSPDFSDGNLVIGHAGGLDRDTGWYQSTDGDSLWDGYERHWFDGPFPDLSLLGTGSDYDGDLLPDEDEQGFATNPTSFDTDGDGYLDGDSYETDPLDCAIPFANCPAP